MFCTVRSPCTLNRLGLHNFEDEEEKGSYCQCIRKCSLRSDLACNCGEEYDSHEWSWDQKVASTATVLSKKNTEVRFHPGYSSGTAAVRGNIPFSAGHIYYWEIKMLTSLYGTDVMVGVGTKQAELDKSTYQFTSLLGSDKESWGFSYTGRLQHNGKTEWYGPPFGKGSIIGIYLDMWRGTLEFFLNRRPLGVAFRSLNKSMLLYPMVCSTAAQSAMRVTYSKSAPISLQLLALQALDKKTTMKLQDIPGLKNYISSAWWLLAGGRGEDCESSLSRCGLTGSGRGRKRLHSPPNSTCCSCSGDGINLCLCSKCEEGTCCTLEGSIESLIPIL